jgi:hypothetical protein
MQITNLYISTTVGENRRPTSGDAVFADGKAYGWMIHPYSDEIVLFNYRRLAGRSCLSSFKSPKRSAAIAAAINA